MVDPIIRKKFKGRQIVPPSHTWPGIGPQLRMWKKKTPSDTPIPKGYRHVGIQKIPIAHQSYKPLQDKVEQQKREEIARTPNGPRRSYLERDLELWVANGRPTYGSPSKRSNKNDWTRTQAKGLGIWADGVHDDSPTRRKRIKPADVLGRDE